MDIRGTRPREVVVRMVRAKLVENAAFVSRSWHLLSADECRVLARLRPQAARRDYLAAHVLARTMLAELLDSDPTRLRVRFARWKPPELVAPPEATGLKMSLSHAEGIALCAVTMGRSVGAGVASMRNVRSDPLAVAEAVCSEREREALRATPAALRAERLVSIWTVKEAVSKALGVGLRMPLVRITVSLEDPAPSLDFGAGSSHDGSCWRLATLRLTPSHLAALAVPCQPGDRVVFRLDEVLLAARAPAAWPPGGAGAPCTVAASEVRAWAGGPD